MLFFLLVIVAAIKTTISDKASDQLLDFKRNTSASIGILTVSNGAPVKCRDTDALNSPLIPNEFFMEAMTHLVRERIPERVVNVKGAGAYGYFEVAHNITNYCKASIFNKLGKKTPVIVRFSQASSEKGTYDTDFDVRGFAVKFFTEEGNFDIVGFNTPMVMVKDPYVVHSIIRVVKGNPVTNIRDDKMVWDVLSLRPESFFIYMYLFADFGIPDGYRHMPGFSIHTYQVYNKCEESFYMRFHFLPGLGIKNLVGEDIAKIALSDPDFGVRDLYDAIATGNYPYWTVYIQVLSYEDVKNAKCDVFDVTKILPEDEYPLMPLGKLVLNRNPTNYFAEVEQLAFSPANLVPGILGGPDHMFIARRFVYRDAQNYRLGANFNNIHVNCPITRLLRYDRDGVPPVGYNGGDAPNYYPNSYNGPIPYVDKDRPTLLTVKHDESYNFDQAAKFYNELPDCQRDRMIANIISSLGKADPFVQQRSIKIFTQIHPNLGYRLVAGLSAST